MSFSLFCKDPTAALFSVFLLRFLFLRSTTKTKEKLFSRRSVVSAKTNPLEQKDRRTKGLLMSAALHLSLKPQGNVSVSWQPLRFCTLWTGYLSFMWIFLQEFTSWFWFYCGLVLYALNFIMCRLCVFVATLIAWPAVPLQWSGEFMCIPNKWVVCKWHPTHTDTEITGMLQYAVKTKQQISSLAGWLSIFSVIT